MFIGRETNASVLGNPPFSCSRFPCRFLLLYSFNLTQIFLKFFSISSAPSARLSQNSYLPCSSICLELWDVVASRWPRQEASVPARGPASPPYTMYICPVVQSYWWHLDSSNVLLLSSSPFLLCSPLLSPPLSSPLLSSPFTSSSHRSPHSLILPWPLSLSTPSLTSLLCSMLASPLALFTVYERHKTAFVYYSINKNIKKCQQYLLLCVLCFPVKWIIMWIIKW